MPTTSEHHMRAGNQPLVNTAEVRQAIEYYAERGWTDGLPVVPVTESYLADFLAYTDRDPDEVLLSMRHLDRACTVRLAASNAALAGCLPEYLPVVLAAWDALARLASVPTGIWQSTTGSAPMLLVNGPVRERLNINSRGNVFGSGFRANATIGRAIRLGAINCFGLRPHELDQATQGTPAKYTCCIGENEEDSPWPGLHVDNGFGPTESTVTAVQVRSVVHLEARHTSDPEQLGRDFAGTLARTGALIHKAISGCLILGPEHAQVFDRAGWGKRDVRQFVFEQVSTTRERLAEVGKDAVSHSGWNVPANHPDATHWQAEASDTDLLRTMSVPEALLVVVAGAGNAGVSAIAETMGPRARGDPPAMAAVNL